LEIAAEIGFGPDEGEVGVVEDVFAVFGDGDFTLKEALHLLAAFEIGSVESVAGFGVALLGSTQEFSFPRFFSIQTCIYCCTGPEDSPARATGRLLGDRGGRGRGSRRSGGGLLVVLVGFLHRGALGGVGFGGVLFGRVLGEGAKTNIERASAAIIVFSWLFPFLKCVTDYLAALATVTRRLATEEVVEVVDFL